MESTFKGVKIDDPAMAIGTLLNSGIVQKLLGTLQNGDLDLGKLMGTMQKAMGSLISQQSTPQITEVVDEPLPIKETSEDNVRSTAFGDSDPKDIAEGGASHI